MRSAAAKRRPRADEDDEEEFDRPVVKRPWWWRLLLRRPRDTLAWLVLVGAAGAIIVNGVYLQHGRHPAPIFAAHALPVAAARDAVGAVHNHVAVSEPPPPAHHEGVELPRQRPGAAASVAPHRDLIGDLIAQEDAHGPRAQPAHATSPAAPAPAPVAPARSLAQPSRQVLAVQQALSEFGYGQLKPNGIYDAETRGAVQSFERARHLPVTEDITPAVRHELSQLTGRNLD